MAEDDGHLLTAVELAELHGGVKKRSVLGWATEDDPCPCVMGERRGRQCKLFDPEQVREWLTARGRDVGGLGDDVDEAAASGEGPPRPAPGQIDLGKLSSRVEGLVDQMLGNLPGKTKKGGADYAAWQRLATALKNCLGELRQLEEQQARRLDREAKVVPRTEAKLILGEYAHLFVGQLDGFRAELPGKLDSELGALPPGDGRRRVIAQQVDAEIMRFRESIAAAVERSLNNLDEAGG